MLYRCLWQISSLTSIAKDIFKDKLREFLLTKILSYRRVNEVLLVSPLQDISDSLSFFAQSCEFLNDYRDELCTFTSDEKLEMCTHLFAKKSIRGNYHSFYQEWNGLYASHGRDLFDTLFIRMCAQSDESDESQPRLLTQGEFAALKIREFKMQSFSSLVYLLLLELIRNGDASQNSNTTNKSKSNNKNTYIIKCGCCGRFFLPSRSNTIYCNQTAPNSDKTCAEIGAKRKSWNKRSPAKKAYENINKKLLKRISDADSIDYNAKADTQRVKYNRPLAKIK